MTYIPTTLEERKKMLREIGVSSIEDVITSIPPEIRLKVELELPPALSEIGVAAVVSSLAEKNVDLDHAISFLGGGVYDHAIPSVIGHIIGRAEFYTAYTPYQPEVSQGTLQSTYEYQSMICHLTEMDVANASLYDGSSSVAEAALLAHAVTQRTDILVAQTLHPHSRRVLDTYCRNMGLTIRPLPWKDGITDVAQLHTWLSGQTACCIIQHPNVFGCLEPMEEIEPSVHDAGALLISAVDPISLGLLKPPGAYGADIAVGDGQVLGNSLSYGGPSFGFFTAKNEFIRRMPGRLVGTTRDTHDRRGFVLTLQTREQHIRREKATSNICTNEALNALAGAVYLSLLGKHGLQDVAKLCLRKSHYALERIEELNGFERRFASPFFKEFVIRTPTSAREIREQLAAQGMFLGLGLDQFDNGVNDCLVLAVTEKRTKDDIDRLVEHLAPFSTQST